MGPLQRWRNSALGMEPNEVKFGGVAIEAVHAMIP